MEKYIKLQKSIDGKKRYTITPCLNGSFIKPDTIIKIGEVSKKYNATIKIGSNQKISIMNLKEKDLEKVLVDLNMRLDEKSKKKLTDISICTANFCKMSKYPVIGIKSKINKAFYNIDVTNKVRIGICGCENSCNGAYLKEIGVIVNKSGKIFITIGGKGGLNPQKPYVLADNLDEETVILTIGRFIDFYNNNSIQNEKLTDFISRITFELILENVIHNY